MKTKFIIISLLISFMCHSQTHNYNWESFESIHKENAIQYKQPITIKLSRTEFHIIKEKKQIYKVQHYKCTGCKKKGEMIIDSLAKEYYYCKDTAIHSQNGTIYYIHDIYSLADGDFPMESRIFISQGLSIYFNPFDISQYSENKALISPLKKDIELYFASKKQQVANENRITSSEKPITTAEKQPVIQNKYDNKDITISFFEKHILNGTIPDNLTAQTKYENGYRAIVWDVPLIKAYEYTNEIFDKLGYDIVKSDYKNKTAYRNCSKGILVEVGNCTFKEGLCITMQWLSPTLSKQNKYFMLCK